MGKLHLLADDTALKVLSWKSPVNKEDRPVTLGGNGIIAWAKRELVCYFAGELMAFSTPISPEGTPFQKQVWAALLEIPYGETRSYGELAAQLGNPGAARAVGGANNKNPICIMIPCHRVIGKNGSLTGFAGGTDHKKYLLELEKDPQFRAYQDKNSPKR